VYHVIGTRHTAVEGARREAERRGYRVRVIDEATTGEARATASDWVGQAVRTVRQTAGPVCVIGSGETTVTVRGRGSGGRNQEFALSAAGSLAALNVGARRAALASAGTDGIDGPTDAAGAIVDSGTLGRARARGMDAAASLADNDTYPSSTGPRRPHSVGPHRHQRRRPARAAGPVAGMRGPHASHGRQAARSAVYNQSICSSPAGPS
jgi:glycerate 2-kinase